MDSDLLADRIFTDTMINNADGSRYETETTTARNGAILGTVWTTTSIDGKTETLVEDKNGDGLGDLQTISAIVKNGDGTSTSTINSFSQNGGYIDGKTVIKSADGLSSTTSKDLTGDQVFDRKIVDTMVINADKSSDHTVTVTSNNGALLSSAVTHQGADLISKTVSIDSNGDGFADVTETVAVDAVTSIRTDTSSTLAPSGTLINRIIAITSADGLSLTTSMDIDGIGEAKNDNWAFLKWRKAS